MANAPVFERRCFLKTTAAVGGVLPLLGLAANAQSGASAGTTEAQPNHEEVKLADIPLRGDRKSVV